MAIPYPLRTLIDQLSQELDQTEQATTEGLNLIRPVLLIFEDNAILMQFFATLSNVLLFVETYRGRVQTAVDRLSVVSVTTEEIQELAEDLATMLGVVLETKIRVGRIITRLENLP